MVGGGRRDGSRWALLSASSHESPEMRSVEFSCSGLCELHESSSDSFGSLASPGCLLGVFCRFYEVFQQDENECILSILASLSCQVRHQVFL